MAFSEIFPSASLRQKLENAGYETIEELKKVNLIQLSKDLQLTKEEVETIITATNKDTKLEKQTMAERIAQAEENGISLCKNLDKLLDKGIPAYRMTEICGESGSGKTQICMQLAINVQLSVEEGGVRGECLYVDTEGSFLPSRLIDMTENHDIESISKGIHVFRILDFIELIAFARQLPNILKQYPNVKLIVIDSIAYHFRLNTFDKRRRNQFVNYLAQTLVQIANRNKVAVVVTNHITVNGPNRDWAPSLGPSWGQWCTNRLHVYRKRQFYFGFLFKSLENSQNDPVQFCIKNIGITDPEEDEKILFKPSAESEAEINKVESAIEERKTIEESQAQERTLDIYAKTKPSIQAEPVVQNSVAAEQGESDPQGKKRPREDTNQEESETEYWSSDMEEDINFLLNMKEML